VARAGDGLSRQVIVFGGYGPLGAGLDGGGGPDGGSLDDLRVLHLVRPDCAGPADSDKPDRARKSLLPG
jgi:hypothetical protein